MFIVKVARLNNRIHVHVTNVELLGYKPRELERLQERLHDHVRQNLKDIELEEKVELPYRRNGQTMEIVYRVPPAIDPKQVNRIADIIRRRAEAFWQEIERRMTSPASRSA